MDANTIPVEIKIIDPRLLSEFGGPPRPATAGAAAADVVACAVFDKKPDGKPDLASRRPMTGPVTLRPGEAVYFGLGFAMDIGDPNYGAFLIPRSGMGSAVGAVMANGIGLLDSDYQNEYMCVLLNRNLGAYEKDVKVNPGDRIAQMYLAPVVRADYRVVGEFTRATARGTGGFGSTGA